MMSNSKSNLKSGVWEHFVRDSVMMTAQCQICKATLKIAGGSTKSLHIHLKAKHDINGLKVKLMTDNPDDVVIVDSVITVGTTAAAAANTGPSTGPAPPVLYPLTNLTLTTAMTNLLQPVSPYSNAWSWL